MHYGSRTVDGIASRQPAVSVGDERTDGVTLRVQQHLSAWNWNDVMAAILKVWRDPIGLSLLTLSSFMFLFWSGPLQFSLNGSPQCFFDTRWIW